MSFIGRPLHYVIRTTDLRKTYDFLVKVFKMRVLRHEENHKPCGITCNGPYNSAWSKTMLGYGVEDVSYCLEVTYNYVMPNRKITYAADDSIQFFGIVVDDVDAAVKEAKDQGYTVNDDNVITGPDSYPYKPLAKPAGERKEPFAGVRLRVSSLEKSVAFYTEVLGMQVIPEDKLEVPLGSVGDGVKSSYVSFEPSQCVYQLIEDPAKGAIKVESGWQGRNALGPANVTPVYERHIAQGGALLHEKRTLSEDPFMEIFIARDPDGYELCLITHAQFCVEAASATDFKEPEWEKRDKFLKTHDWEFEGPSIVSSNIAGDPTEKK